MTSIYLFRHGNTDFPKELIGGRSNEVPLTDKGRRESHELGLWIAHQELTPDFIAVSPADRTRETARIALSNLGLMIEPIIEERLQELTKGDAEGRLRDEVHTPEVLERMRLEGNDFKYSNGESNNETARRMHDWVFEMLQDRAGQIIFGFTHGVATRCLVAKYLDWSLEQFNDSTVENTAATIMHFDGDELIDLRFNVSTRSQ